MNIFLIIVGIFSFASFLCALAALVTIRKYNPYIFDNAELYKSLAEFKGGIIEKIVDKNMSFSNDIMSRIENLKDGNQASLDKINNTLSNSIKDFQKNMFDQFNNIALSVNKSLHDNRTESGQYIENFRNEVTNKLIKTDDTLNGKITKFQNDIFTQFDTVSSSVNKSLLNSRIELKQHIETFKNDITVNLSAVNKTLEDKISLLQKSNEEKLEKMRGVVEEKLEKTLNERLRLSFDSVNKNLERVQKGLGEMQNLAVDVGGLKKAITNVKTKGVFGEVQLERILEQMLTSSQYEKNFQVKPNLQERVEFAIKLPGKNDERPVYLPIDSKFPSEDYDALLIAYDNGDKQTIDKARKSFAMKIKSFASDISRKYIEPPVTSDFAILFLPFESLYAEVVQTPGLFEELQKKYRIVVTGPTTISAFLNALQIGFQTVAIEKRSSEVWSILASVKKEFSKFGDVLSKIQKSLQKADDDLSTLVGTRTNAINKQLKSVQDFPDSDNHMLLSDTIEE